MSVGSGVLLGATVTQNTTNKLQRPVPNLDLQASISAIYIFELMPAGKFGAFVSGKIGL